MKPMTKPQTLAVQSQSVLSNNHRAVNVFPSADGYERHTRTIKRAMKTRFHEGYHVVHVQVVGSKDRRKRCTNRTNPKPVKASGTGFVANPNLTKT